jgi:hypothetical protein
MPAGATIYPDSIDATMIAPCGMDCGLCSGHLREKNRCAGCNGDDATKPAHCVVCAIKYCPELAAAGGLFCYECAKFPCRRLKQLDTRYRAKYRMSMIENLASIRDTGLQDFVAREKVRWACPQCGGVACVHKDACLYCGHVWE